jgi:4-hydroxy-2-oxoheptanedioate aldolase
VLALSAQDQARYAGWGARLFATVTTGIITQALRQAAQAGDAGTKY